MIIRRKMKKLICVSILVILSVFSLVSCKADDYDKALELIEAGENEEAYELLKSVGFYKNAKKMLKDFYFVPTRIGNEYKNADIIYDERHFPVKYVLHRNNGKEDSAFYEFDDNGFLLSVYYDENLGDSEIKYFYNRDGSLANEIMYWSFSESIAYAAAYTYDDDGNMIEKDYGDLKRIYTYDRKGKLVKAFSTTGEPNAEERVVTKYFYDSKGRLIKKVCDPLSKYNYSEYFYDSKGRLVKTEGDYVGEIETITSVYDDNDNLVEEIMVRPYYGEERHVYIEYECIYAPNLPSKIKERLDVNVWRELSCWWIP